MAQIKYIKTKKQVSEEPAAAMPTKRTSGRNTASKEVAVEDPDKPKANTKAKLTKPATKKEANYDPRQGKGKKAAETDDEAVPKKAATKAKGEYILQEYGD